MKNNDEDGGNDESSLHSWERKLLIVAFSGWALVVAGYGQGALNRIDKIVDQNSVLDRRLTIVEERQNYVLTQIAKFNQEIENEKNK